MVDPPVSFVVKIGGLDVSNGAQSTAADGGIRSFPDDPAPSAKSQRFVSASTGFVLLRRPRCESGRLSLSPRTVVEFSCQWFLLA